MKVVEENNTYEENMKTCKSCNIGKSLDQFKVIRARENYPSYYGNDCKDCVRQKARIKYKAKSPSAERLEKRRAWWAKNSTRLAVKARELYHSDPEFRRRKLDSSKKYRAANKEELRERERLSEKRIARNKMRWKDPASVEKLRVYYSVKRKRDPQYRLKQSLRKRVRECLKGKYKPASIMDTLGCSIEFLQARFESMFHPGMTWDNMGEWHVDHIIPLSLFDLSNKEQYKIACHYTNLQPLWAKENIKKSNKLLKRSIYEVA